MPMSSYWCDGLARGNPGPAALGVTSDTGWEYRARLGVATNNQAEYAGLIITLERIPPGGAATIYMDSRLVVNQVTDRWRCKSKNLKTLYERAKALLEDRHVRVEWVPRGRNQRADELANEALDANAEILSRDWWTPREKKNDSLECPDCGASEINVKLQRFKDGTRHRRAECAKCGRFIKYLPKN